MCEWTRSLLEAIGYMPPAEAEANYWRPYGQRSLQLAFAPNYRTTGAGS
jgi:hypothetical protein